MVTVGSRQIGLFKNQDFKDIQTSFGSGVVLVAVRALPWQKWFGKKN